MLQIRYNITSQFPHMPTDNAQTNLETRSNIASVTTAQGSVYRYLPDGRTQRYQTIFDVLHEPQDILVFVPNFDWVQKHAPKDIQEQLGRNATQYMQLLLSYVQGHGKKRYIIDQNGRKLRSNKEVDEFGRVYLTLGDASKVDFYIPVFPFPRLGFSTFDTRKYKVNGEYFRERHLGNNVVDIQRTKV